MSQEQTPYWKDILSAVVMTGGKMVPGVGRAIEVIETLENRREATFRHGQTLESISRVEKSVTEIIEREMKSVLEKLHAPNLTPRDLEEEIANLYAMRGYGREPFLSQGLLANSQWYEQLRSKPNLYGRVLQDSDKPSVECFYMFIDTDKTRLLEVSPFALQQLLAGQAHGAPAARLIGRTDIFAERVAGCLSSSAIKRAHGVKMPHAAVTSPAPLVRVISPVNSTSMPFVRINPGTFMMGSPGSEPERSADETYHEVTLTRGFYMAETTVTQAQWTAVMGSNPSFIFTGEKLPVENVSWDDAVAFCRNLTDRDRKLYRLPTEAEWEYGCRAGTTTPFSFGETIGTEVANYYGNYVYGKGKKGECRERAVPVDQFAPNPWGLRQMHGNVWEWCQDYCAAYSGRNETDPTGPKQGGGSASRVLRGGSWDDSPDHCRSAYRSGRTPDGRHPAIGFRVVLDLP